MEEDFQIFISLPTDDVCTLKGLSHDTRIYQLKSRVELKTGIPGDVQHLYFMNKELYDNYKLDDVKLKAGCIVRVKLDTTWLNLFEACWRGDIYEVFQNGVQHLDEKEFGKSYNIPLWNRIVVQRATNALFIASHRGFLGLIIELLNHGAAEINGKTRFGRTCLHVAAYQGFVGCVSLLLSEGALCNQIDYNGKTALALASENGHIYCERRLWLYQMSLKALRGMSQTDSKDKSEDSLDGGRTQFRNTGKTLRLNANKMLLKEADEKQEHRKLDFHLPRVQNYEVQNSPSSTPDFKGKDELAGHFPFVQIVEKYRREYRNMSSSKCIPNMVARTNNSRSRTAPAPTSPREHKPEERNEVQMVDEANTVDEKEAEKDGIKVIGVSEDDVLVKDKVAADDDHGQTKPLKRDTKVILSEASIAIAESDITNKERPQTSKPYVRRHLDSVISTTVERKSHENSTGNVVPLDFRCPSDEPPSYSNFDVTDYAYRPRKPVQTFESWLEKKRNQGQLRPMTAHAPEKSKLGKSIDPDVFKNWLNKKRRNHSRSNSESSSTCPKKSYISSGMTFERWLQEKKKMACTENNESTAASETPDTGRRTRAISAGKTYEDWLNEKLKQVQSTSKNDEESKKNGPKSGKTFKMWLLEKQNQKQIEVIHRATEEKERQRQVELEQYQKYLNPNFKTFEEWLAIKKQEHLLERERLACSKQNEPSSQEKKKDSDLVFGIWLTMKFVKEMQEEEEKYDEMREKWERKEKQRAALRSAIHMSRLLKKKNVISEADDAESRF